MLAVLAIAQQSGDIIAGPDLVSRGVVADEASPEVFEGARAVVLDALERHQPRVAHRSGRGEGGGPQGLRRYFKRLDRRPVILPFVLEM